MNVRRAALIILVLFALSAPFVVTAQVAPKPAAGDLGFGKWTFTGKDKAGVVWTGTLDIQKTDTSMFDPHKYIAQGDLQVEAASGAGNGALAPITYDPAKRLFTLGVDTDYGGSVYTAVLSPDGKSLIKGVWKQTERWSNEKEKRVLSEGEWSAVRVE